MTLYDSYKRSKRKKLAYGGDWTELGQGPGITLNKPAHSPYAYAPAGGYKSPAQVNAGNYNVAETGDLGSTQGVTGDQIGAGVTGAFSLAQAFMTDKRPRGYYEQSGGEMRTNEGLKYGAQGASLGASIGGPIGAVVGGAAGMLGGYFMGAKKERQHNEEVGKRQSLFKKSERLEMEGRGTPGFSTGNRNNQMYGDGGKLKKKTTTKSTLAPAPYVLPADNNSYVRPTPVAPKPKPKLNTVEYYTNLRNQKLISGTLNTGSALAPPGASTAFDIASMAYDVQTEGDISPGDLLKGDRKIAHKTLKKGMRTVPGLGRLWAGYEAANDFYDASLYQDSIGMARQKKAHGGKLRDNYVAKMIHQEMMNGGRIQYGDGGKLKKKSPIKYSKKWGKGYVDLSDYGFKDPFSKDAVEKAKELSQGDENIRYVCTASGCAQIASNVANSYGVDNVRGDAWDIGNKNPVVYQNPTYKDKVNDGKAEMLPNPKSYKVPEEYMKTDNVLTGLNRPNTASSVKYANPKKYPNSRGYEHMGFKTGNTLIHGTSGNEKHPAYYVADNLENGVNLPGYGQYEVVEAMDEPGVIDKMGNYAAKAGGMISDTAKKVGNKISEAWDNFEFAHGGSLQEGFAKSKNMHAMSSDSVEVIGPKHAQGGVDVPGTDAEVEGGETITGDYVMSDRLSPDGKTTFAKLHRPVAKAIGKIEKKPATRERVNSLRLLKEREEKLKKQQELMKQRLNLQ